MTMELTPKEFEQLVGLSPASQRAWDKEGLMMGHYGTTTGGHRRYDVTSAVHVAIVKTLNDMGYALQDAAILADVVHNEVVSQATGRVDPEKRSEVPLFIWRDIDAVEIRRASVSGERCFLMPSGFFGVRLHDLNLVPTLSKAGGFVLYPRSLAAKLPAKILDLLVDQ
jgi:DNA-binding transcriptional MerR regulator